MNIESDSATAYCALRWFVTARDNPTAQKHAELQKWLAENRNHRKHYQKLESVWQLLDKVEIDVARAS